LKTSVIIPSYNPTLKLSETLDKLVPQTVFIDELIIIIDNENYSDYTKSLMEMFSSTLKLKIYSQPNSGRAAARNKGAEISTGDIIIFLDDDMLAEKDLIEKHIQYHNKSFDTIVSGNGYRNPKYADYNFGGFLIQMEEGWKRDTIGIGDITLQKFNFTACNMSLPKSVFIQLNGFDTRFSDGEDFDFGVRAIIKGIRIIYDTNLLAWHNDWPAIDTYIKRQNEYTEAKIEITKAHPEYLKYFPKLKIEEGSKVKKLISGIIRSTIGKWVVSRGFIFEVLPRNIKFFFYRITIASFSNINR
jgi:GT2 family glycosyltransferase